MALLALISEPPPRTITYATSTAISGSYTTNLLSSNYLSETTNRDSVCQGAGCGKLHPRTKQEVELKSRRMDKREIMAKNDICQMEALIFN